MTYEVLVTGGAGFIGSFLVDKLVDKGHNVTIFDNLEPQVHYNKTPDYLNPKAKFIKGDIRNYDAIKEHVKVADIVFNFAARVGVGQSMYEIKEYVDSNDLGTANLMHALANEEHHVQKVIVASSMSIYGEGSYQNPETQEEYHNIQRSLEHLKQGIFELKDPQTGTLLEPIPTKETKPLASDSVYAITKKNQEEITLNVGKTYGIPSVALRFFNTYGPRQSLSNPYTGVAAIFMSRIKNNNAPLIFEDGLQARDFISVHDIVHASMLAMDQNAANYETFNVGTGEKTNVKQVAETLLELFNSDLVPVINKEFRKGDIRHCYADITKIKHKLEFEPKVKFKEGMAELIDWSRTTDSTDYVNKAYKELKDKKLI